MVVIRLEDRKLYTQGNSLTLALPADMVKDLDWQPGDTVAVSQEDGKKGRFLAIYKR